MIITVTLNPTIDKTVTVERLSSHDPIRTKGSTNVVGGKGINVSRVIKLLGGRTLASGFLGGVSGEWIKRQLSECERIPHDFVKIKGESRTNITILEDYNGKEIHLVEPGPSVSNKEIERLIKKLKKLIRKAEFIVFSGSIPPNVPPDIYAQLIRTVKKEKNDIVTALDTSGEPLKLGFKEKPSIMKPNGEEAEYLTGEKIDSLKEACGALRFFLKNGILFPIISLSTQGIVAFYQGKAYEAIPPKIKPLCTVGSGDSLLGGIIFGLQKRKEIEEILRIGLSCGIANALTKGAGILKKSHIRGFYGKIKVNLLPPPLEIKYN